MSNEYKFPRPDEVPPEMTTWNPVTAVRFWASTARILPCLIEGAIFGPKLWHPLPGGALACRQAVRADYVVGYNPNRAPIAGIERNDPSLITEGQLAVEVSAKIFKRPGTRRTSLATVSFFDTGIDSWQRQSPKIEHLLEDEYAREVPYAAAFESLHMGEYLPDLEAAGVADTLIYQVTPKGNGRIELVSEAGGVGSPASLRRLLPGRLLGFGPASA